MPNVLVATGLLWPNVVRLSRAFRDVGFEVAAIALAQHPVHRSQAPQRTFEYRPKSPLESLRQAIAAQKPDIIVPCDDRVVGHLCALRTLEDKELSALIDRSLGRSGASGVLSRRATLGEISRLPHVDVPRIDSVRTAADVRDWAHKFGFPAILKLDGSWGGNDVVVIRRESEILKAFWEMKLRQSALRGFQQYVTRRDVEALNRRRSEITIQSYVSGKPANITVACWRGEMLADIAVEVVELASRFGAATVVHAVDGGAMTAAARSICSHYGLSGLYGFDFIIDDRSGAAKLIEINPRATQIGHLNLGRGHDLATALFEAVSGRAATWRPCVRSADISLFPGEWRRDPKSPHLASSFHDVPYDEPDLARFYGFNPSGEFGPQQVEKTLAAR
jgi:carbamoylphosphate synthase large subunit